MEEFLWCYPHKILASSSTENVQKTISEPTAPIFWNCVEELLVWVLCWFCPGDFFEGWFQGVDSLMLVSLSCFRRFPNSVPADSMSLLGASAGTGFWSL